MPQPLGLVQPSCLCTILLPEGYLSALELFAALLAFLEVGEL